MHCNCQISNFKDCKYIIYRWKSYNLINTSNFQDLNFHSFILNIKLSKIKDKRIKSILDFYFTFKGIFFCEPICWAELEKLKLKTHIKNDSLTSKVHNTNRAQYSNVQIMSALVNQALPYKKKKKTLEIKKINYLILKKKKKLSLKQRVAM